MNRKTPFQETASLTISLLASGSRGNAIYISDGRTAVLVDAGLSGVEIERRLKHRQLNACDLDAIVVSHEHADHIKGVGVLARRLDLPVYLSAPTRKAAESFLGRVPEIRSFCCGRPFTINGLAFSPFSTSHDADDPAGFTITHAGIKIGIATDLGQATAVVRTYLKHCRLLVLEANHDPEMLLNGPYPWPLKQRIKSRLGHLSNREAGELLKSLLHDRLEKIVLAHLSESNNTPDRALNTVGLSLTRRRIPIAVATQDRGSDVFRLQAECRNTTPKEFNHDRRQKPRP